MGKMAAAMAISLHSLVPCIFENEYKVKLLKMFTREQQRRQYLQEYWQEDAIPTGGGWNTVADMEDADCTRYVMAKEDKATSWKEEEVEEDEEEEEDEQFSGT